MPSNLFSFNAKPAIRRISRWAEAFLAPSLLRPEAYRLPFAMRYVDLVMDTSRFARGSHSPRMRKLLLAFVITFAPIKIPVHASDLTGEALACEGNVPGLPKKGINRQTSTPSFAMRISMDGTTRDLPSFRDKNLLSSPHSRQRDERIFL